MNILTKAYFFKLESLPTIKESRINSGLPTVATGCVTIWRWWSYDKMREKIIKSVADEHKKFNENELIITGLSKF